MAPTSPTVAAWALGLRLREKRTESGLSGAKAAERIGTAPAYLSDVEHGKKTVAADRLNKMIEVYDFNADEAEELRALREDATGRGWWTKYSALFSEDLLRYFGFEHGAETLATYDSDLINGLLQTEEYARSIIQAGAPNLRMAEVERRVQCRMERQRRVTGSDPLKFTTVMSEAVLKQHVGGPEVQAAQLHHLVELIETHPQTLEVFVVPFVALAHPALGGSAFALMTFPSGKLPTLLWQETVTSTHLITDGLTSREYDLAHSEAFARALNKEESLQMIKENCGVD